MTGRSGGVEAFLPEHRRNDPATYWISWQVDGSLASGPWAPPVTYNGADNGLNPLGQAPNGMQSISGGAFNPVLDSGSQTGDEFPFIINGFVSGGVIPEPGTALVWTTLAGFGLFVSRRRR